MRQIGNVASSDAEAITASLVDPTCFSILVERHFVSIHRYLVHRIGPEADDLAAETFVQAFGARRRYDTERSDALPWLYGIASNLVRRHRRSEMRQLTAYARVGDLLDTSAESADDDASVLDTRAEASRMAAAFATLDDDQRDALYLVAVVGLRYEQAATALGCRVGTVHSRVARGRARLRDLVRSNGEEEDECHRGTMDRS
jgi:RNA polymerase sigma factor (sigma-70 family)